MKTDDVILKWMQRIWIFAIAPMTTFIIYYDLVYNKWGSGGGVLALLAYPLTKLAAWPIGTLLVLVFGELLSALSRSSRIADYLIVLLSQPIIGVLQWFLLVPWLFKKWSFEARRRFWVVWFVSIPIMAVALFLLWFYF
ncbi:MAG: hypothetical protein HUU37_07025 [Bdellovibrionales bacterium]|nr:hypothetical protein [Bdellovibrionales bacterium]